MINSFELLIEKLYNYLINRIPEKYVRNYINNKNTSFSILLKDNKIKEIYTLKSKDVFSFYIKTINNKTLVIKFNDKRQPDLVYKVLMSILNDTEVIHRILKINKLMSSTYLYKLNKAPDKECNIRYYINENHKLSCSFTQNIHFTDIIER